jgi:16S rRNA (uracil1498-N3)-methyltransferase
MQLFYIPQIVGNSVTLPEEESKHCIRVLRMVKGDTLELVDGKGNLYHCSVSDDNAKRCTVIINNIEPEFGKRSFKLHIAIAPTKNIERIEWFLEKCTEIGIDEITPILCERSERKNINQERLERVMIAAMKQSVKAYLPKLNSLTPIDKLLQNATESTKLIAYCGNFQIIHAKSLIETGKSVLFLIGPEGDFSPSEIEKAVKNGFKVVGLGSSRLRTETAGVLACTLANLFNEV